MSYDLFVNCSIWNFSSPERNAFIEFLKQEGFKESIDFEVTDNLNVKLLSFKTVNDIINIKNYFQDKFWREHNK